MAPPFSFPHDEILPTWTGISGDRWYKSGPKHKFELVDNPWLEENIITNHGPLRALYPKLEYIMEGDTPCFLGLIRNGLGGDLSPAYSGWAGRYVLYQAHGETRPLWTNNANSRDTVTAENGVSEGLTTNLKLPGVERAGTVHVILQVEDDGHPRLFAYHRAIVEVSP